MIWRETVKNICNATLLRSIPMPEVMAGKTVLVSGHASLRAISKLLEEGNSMGKPEKLDIIQTAQFFSGKNGMYLQDEGASFRSNPSKFPERMIDYVGKNNMKISLYLAENKTPFPTFFGNDHPTQLQDLPDDKVGQCPWCSRWCKSQLDSGAKEAKYNWCQMILSFRSV